MNLQQVVQYLLQEGYMVQVKGKYKITAKFNKEMTGQEIGVLPSTSGLMMLEPPALPARQSSTDWRQRYIAFIQEAEIPERGKGSDGNYDLNKYSEKAAKEFRRMLEKEGVSYPILVKSTLLYYKTHSRCPVSISRYIEGGLWRTDYLALMDSVRDGTVTNHIQKEIDHEKAFSKYRLG